MRGYSSHNGDCEPLGDGEWLIRGFIKGTHQEPNRRRIIARRVDRQTVRLIEQMARGVSKLNSEDPHWEDIDVLGDIEWSTVDEVVEVEEVSEE